VTGLTDQVEGAPPSHYVDLGFYDRLQRDLRGLDETGVSTDPALRASCEALLLREARLLDQAEFEDWLELFVPECLYWIPASAGGGDPSSEVTIAFDDRRRLEDRVAWIRSAYIWSQIPRSRTLRLITNVEVGTPEHPYEAVVRSNFTLHDVRPSYRATFPGWYVHRLRDDGDGWRIVVKQTNLLDCDQAHTNVSIIF
jgi:benzoate/toluate 1,2-dioxygenase beta subunit